ncbi:MULTISPECIES: hypothetical protein [unclassified Cryobacterium]|uniref:hypothetical protein n=1 Tax=unclassified Cryobacterium TaxID=2649013 RepID=UPI002AB507EA|nr:MULTISPECIES: hypothetical protein [unclassified Cryobacterium]MDY7528481.1 hypothetical protein [Cryobacterium sp. 10C2]MDY7555774.1 hypothetical protein [Cryobacterium sp. 10C3]MEB0289201.1 hypothetical protein [Cryobacterium sp. 10C2]
MVHILDVFAALGGEKIVSRIALNEWEGHERRARATFALARLNNLDTLNFILTRTDLFDAAFAIWDDFIDGRTIQDGWREADDIAWPELREHAAVFARVAAYMPGRELLALADKAWESRAFAVPINLGGRLAGSIERRPDRLAIRYFATNETAGLTAIIKPGNTTIRTPNLPLVGPRPEHDRTARFNATHGGQAAA